MASCIRRSAGPSHTVRSLCGLAALAIAWTAQPARADDADAAPRWPASGPPPTIRAADAAGARFAYAEPVDERGRRSTVTLLEASGEAAGAVELPGVVHALQFDTTAERLFALLERPARRGAGERELHAVDLATLGTSRLMRVPPGTADLDLWTLERALLLAVPDQIRTVLLNGLRSGPLFAVPGRNRAVASIGGGNLVLAGQDDALLLVDLADPPGRDAMPILERWIAPSPVVAIVPARDAAGARVELADGSRHRVTLEPFGVRPDRAEEPAIDAPFAAVRPATYRKPAPPTPPTSPAPTAPPAVAGRELDDARATGPGATTDPAPALRVDRSASSGRDEPPVGSGSPDPSGSSGSAVRSAPADPVPDKVEIPPAEPPPPAAPGGLAGRVDGPAAGMVAAVVLLGPDSLLREAARVPVAEDGSWSAGGLAPGRYKVQVDGGGGRVLVSQPPFQVVEIGVDRATPSIVFRVLRAL